MSLQSGSAAAVGAGTGVCGDCGAEVGGNFCSSCGADLRASSFGFLGSAVRPVRRSFPAIYLKLLWAPIRQTVAFAEDPTYRSHVSFALTGITIYCLFIVPVVMRVVAPADGPVHVSDSMLNLMRVLSQVGIYVGTAITFALSYMVFRALSRVKRPLHAYFKLFCLALGFSAPINGAYEFTVRNVLHGTGLSSFGTQMTLNDVLTPTGVSSIVLMVLMFTYFTALNRRFWEMAAWKAVGLYLATTIVANQIGYYLMWFVGFYTARVLTAAGIVTI